LRNLKHLIVVIHNINKRTNSRKPRRPNANSHPSQVRRTSERKNKKGLAERY
jgi:hypothetical protein